MLTLLLDPCFMIPFVGLFMGVVVLPYVMIRDAYRQDKK